MIAPELVRAITQELGREATKLQRQREALAQASPYPGNLLTLAFVRLRSTLLSWLAQIRRGESTACSTPHDHAVSPVCTHQACCFGCTPARKEA